MEFKDRTVLITGAGGNLGTCAVANAFAERGANLVLVDLNKKALEKAFGAENQQRLLAPTNLLQPDRLDATVKTAIERFQRIDVLANLAGGFRMGEPVHATSDGDWNFLLDINARTLLHTVRAVVPRMLYKAAARSSMWAPFPPIKVSHNGCLLRGQERCDSADRDPRR